MAMDILASATCQMERVPLTDSLAYSAINTSKSIYSAYTICHTRSTHFPVFSELQLSDLPENISLQAIHGLRVKLFGVEVGGRCPSKPALVRGPVSVVTALPGPRVFGSQMQWIDGPRY